MRKEPAGVGRVNSPFYVSNYFTGRIVDEANLGADLDAVDLPIERRKKAGAVAQRRAI